MAEEFSIIDKIIRTAGDLSVNQSFLRVPPGDDAALLKTLKNPVISTDSQRENIHFNTSWQSYYEIGAKAVTISLSDLAASYASPVALFINIGIPPVINEDNITSLYRGICESLNFYNCSLGGGNISSSDSLSIDLFAVGEGHDHNFPLRSKAKSGESLYITGSPGKARAGLDALQRGCPEYFEMIESFKKPLARFDAAEVLYRSGVNCVMDLSDGLSGDAEHIAKASGISIIFRLDEKDLDPEFINYCNNYSLSAIDMALAGGEEYELLFTCSPEKFEKIKQELPGAVKAGDCLDFEGIHIINPPLVYQSYIHNRETLNAKKEQKKKD